MSKAADALESVDLGDHRNTATNKLSGGMRARLSLATALVTEAEFLLLDEPMAALDPAQRQAFAALVSTLSSERDIVISTHDVLDLDRGFDHVIVLWDGSPVFSGTVKEFLVRGGGAATSSATDAYLGIINGVDH